jgi:hypothetical protein
MFNKAYAAAHHLKAARFRDHANPKKSRIVNNQSVNVQYLGDM